MDYELSSVEGTPSTKRREVHTLLEKFGAEDEASALVTAVEENDVGMVQELLHSGVDVSVRDRAGNTLLHRAARLGYVDMCGLLVTHGVDVNAQNIALFTPLALAARVSLRMVSVLLDLGAEVERCNHLGEIPLHAASSSGLIDVIVTLVSSGSDVNAQSGQGLTPLYFAVSSGSRQAVKTLFRLGAEVNEVLTQESASSVQNPSEQSWKDKASDVNLCETLCSWKNPSQRPKCQNVRVRVPRASELHQQQHSSSIRAAIDSHGPECDKPGILYARQHQRGLFSGSPSWRQPDDWCDRALPFRIHSHSHHHHHHHHRCPRRSNSQYQHRLKKREEFSFQFSNGHATFNVTENDSENLQERVCELSTIPESTSQESLSEDSTVSQIRSISESSQDEDQCNEVLVPGIPIRTSSTHHSHPQFSTRPVQIGGKSKYIQNSRGELASHCLNSVEKGHIVQSMSLCGGECSGPFSQSHEDYAAEQFLNQPNVRFTRFPYSRQTKQSSRAESLQGLTPLHRAAELGMETVAQVLLEAGANVNAQTAQGETPLHFAALHASTSGHGEVTGLIRLLLGAGADIEAVTAPGASTPLHLAALVGDALCTSILLSAKADLHRRDSQGNSPLHKACERIVSPEANHLRTVRLLLMSGASAREVNNEGLTPLHVLLMHRTEDMDHDMVRALLNHHADPNQPLPSGEAPLLLALRHHMLSFASLLVEKGADPNVQADDGATPLHHVCKDGHSQLFKLIWSKGGNPAVPDRNGFTPLCYAVENGQDGIVHACVKSGAAACQPSSDLISPASLSELFENPARCSSPFQHAFASARLSFMALLYHTGSFSFTELHILKNLCLVVDREELTPPQQEVVAFVLGVSRTPASLQNLSCWTISRLIGCGPTRKSLARKLDLPPLLRDFVLFLRGV